MEHTVKTTKATFENMNPQIRYGCRNCGEIHDSKPGQCVKCGFWKFWGIRD